MSDKAIVIRFLGGASEIGASSALVQVAGRSILVDAGVRFRSDRALPDLDQLSGLALDAVLLTHAHSDHSGALPVVHEAFPAAPIYMTPPTRGLVEILQRDALKLMKLPGERESEVPLYTERQVEGMMERILPVHHDASFSVGEVRVTYLPASHILGASMVHLDTPFGAVMFTGDYSVTPQRTVAGLPRPRLPVDLVVTESTYGNRSHADRRLAEERFVRTVAEVVDKGGRVLVPAFAIGRAQEVLLVLRDALRHGKMPSVPVFVDGMVRSVCGVYPQHERYLAPGLARLARASGHPFFGGEVRAVKDASDRKQIVAGGACVIVSSSGMLSGGPSASYAAELAPNEKDAILVTGYQDEESPGRALLSLARNEGPRRLSVGGREVDVRCRFEAYSLSAHADRMQMVGLLEALSPRTVVLVHGDTEAKQTLARSLGARDVVIGEDGARIERAYLRRGGAGAARVPRLDRAKAEALVGPDTGATLDAGAVADAWLGHEAGSLDRERLVMALIELGVVRRDDEDPSKLRSLVPPTAPPPDTELEERLKRENPKGKLLEWCMRERVELRTMLDREERDGHMVELGVAHAGREHRSGARRGSSKKVAEQLAAEALLESLGRGLGAESARRVTREEAPLLRAKNPKGRVLERCAQLRLGAPSVEATSAPGGAARRVGMGQGDEVTWSSWYVAESARDAEQAAFAELLEQLNFGSLAAAAPVDQALSPGSTHPKSTLNTMQQTGLIDAFGFDLVGQGGTIHAPVFEVRGWFDRDGERTAGPSATGATKKEAELRAAAELLSLARRG